MNEHFYKGKVLLCAAAKYVFDELCVDYTIQKTDKVIYGVRSRGQHIKFLDNRQLSVC